jgi:hypothetical protein
MYAYSTYAYVHVYMQRCDDDKGAYTSALEANTASRPASPVSKELFLANLPGAKPPSPVGRDFVGEAGVAFFAVVLGGAAAAFVFAAVFLAGAFVAGVFVAGVFVAGVFLFVAAVFLAGIFFFPAAVLYMGCFKLLLKRGHECSADPIRDH